MGKIKGWKKFWEYDYALGKTEQWRNSNSGIVITLEGSIGRYGSKEYRLDITNFLEEFSSDRNVLKRKAIKYMRGHPNG